MERWKINLIVLWIGQFITMGGMTMIIPFLPYYIQEMGVTDSHQVAVWSGLIFAANFVTSFIFQPIWGGIADRKGRKIMLLRSGVGMAIAMLLMGTATAPWQLLLYRMLNGTVSGFVPAGIALMSTNTPKEKMGFAMGTLQSGATAGTILGPLFGGLLAQVIGYRHIFYITGSLLLLATLITMLLVKEKFDRKEVEKKPKISFVAGLKQLVKIKQLPALYSVTILIQFALLSSMPIIPLFVQELYHGPVSMLAFYAGLVSSITGFSNMLASPILGKYSDKLGAQKILGICLIGAAVAFIPQIFVQNIWQLLLSRFLQGIFMGGLLPSVLALINKYTPAGMESRSISYNMSALSMGNMLGPTLGGVLSGFLGNRGIFALATVLLLLNAVWVRISLHDKKKQAA